MKRIQPIAAAALVWLLLTPTKPPSGCGITFYPLTPLPYATKVQVVMRIPWGPFKNWNLGDYFRSPAECRAWRTELQKQAADAPQTRGAESYTCDNGIMTQAVCIDSSDPRLARPVSASDFEEVSPNLPRRHPLVDDLGIMSPRAFRTLEAPAARSNDPPR
jgi:hypothetical protein